MSIKEDYRFYKNLPISVRAELTFGEYCNISWQQEVAAALDEIKIILDTRLV